MRGAALRRAGPAVLAMGWSLLVAGLFLAMEPSRTLRAESLVALLRAAVALPWALALVGAGRALLTWLQPEALDDDLAWPRALAVGFVAFGLLSLPAAWLGGLGLVGTSVLLLLLASGWLWRVPMRPLPVSWRSAEVAGMLLLGGLLLLPALLQVLAPSWDTDEIYYHLALPKQIAENHALVGGTLAPNGSRPLALHLPWTFLLLSGGEGAPRLLHLFFLVALALALHVRARERFGATAGLLAPLFLLGNTSVLQHAGLAHSDLPAAFLVFIAFDAALRGGLLRLVALTAGGAMAVKYTAALAVLPLFALLPFLGGAGRQDAPRPSLRACLLTGLGALAVVAPWGIRNVANGLHFLFPFAGWAADGNPFPFQYPQKYGLGALAGDLPASLSSSRLLALLSLPFLATMKAHPQSLAFLGRVSPVFLFALPVVAFQARRSRELAWSLALVLAGGLLWALNVQWLRYALPLLPIAALAAAGALGRGRTPWIAVAGGMVWLLGLPANLSPILQESTDLAPVVLAKESREDFLARRVPSYEAIRWINERTPAEARIALLFTWEAFLVDRPTLLGSVEDHVPTRFFLNTWGEASLETLGRFGVTHVLTTDKAFVRKSYPFLDSEAYDRDFASYERLLTGLLERQARLVFEDGRFQVWALPVGVTEGEPSP